MTLAVSTFALIAAAAFWIASLAAALAWAGRRQTPGARSLFLLMLAVAIWALGAAIELTVVDLDAKVRWSQFEYLGTLAAPVLWLVFALDFARLDAWLTRPRAIALALVPSLTLALAVTNDHHHLIWSGFHPSTDGLNLLVFERGPAFWVGVLGYSYLCLIAGTLVVLHAAIRLPGALRRQAITLLVAVAIPWLANAGYIFGFPPVRGLDPTPLSMAAMGLVCAYAIFRQGLLDLLPLAREVAIERTLNGVVVFDAENRVIDANPAARRLLGGRGLAPGARLAATLADWPELVRAAADARPVRLGLAVAGDPPRVLEADLTPVADPSGRREGRLLVLHDVTEHERVTRDLRAANLQLEASLARVEALQSSLRDQATRDGLTGLFNRRYLDETLAREFARAERMTETISVVLLDLDHFKALNDAHGHAAGDEVLRELGLLLRSRTRRADIACRYGGEEFLIAMPGMDTELAVTRAEDLRVAFEAVAFTGAAQGLSCTLSAGVASFPAQATTLEGLLAGADLALYAAKAAGRNRVRVAS